MWPVDSNGWYAHTCYNYRASSDNKLFVQSINVGNVISFKAGYKIWSAPAAPATTGSPTPNTLVAFGYNSALLKFTIADSATHLKLTTAVEAIVTTMF